VGREAREEGGEGEEPTGGNGADGAGAAASEGDGAASSAKRSRSLPIVGVAYALALIHSRAGQSVTRAAAHAEVGIDPLRPSVIARSASDEAISGSDD
jgi:hypothetical protein